MNRTRRTLATLATLGAGALLAVGAGTATASTLTNDTLVDNASGLTVQGCAVRFDPATHKPMFAPSAGHSCPGFNSVIVNGRGDLLVDTDNAGLVVSAIATPDETLVAQGISAGVSRGLELAVVRFSDRNGIISANDGRLYLPNANVWLLFVGVAQ